MAREITDTLKDLIDGHSGKPRAVVKLYATNFPYPSDGFQTTYYTPYSSETQRRERTRKRRVKSDVYIESIDLIDIISGRYLYGRPIRRYSGVDYTHPENQLRFYFGDEPPPGINALDLRDRRRWAAQWTGFFYVDRPGFYDFRFISSCMAQITVGNTIACVGLGVDRIKSVRPDQRAAANSTRTLHFSDTGFVSIRVTYTTYGDDAQVFRDQEESRFVAMWKYGGTEGGSEDDESFWRVLDCSHVVSGFRFINLAGSLIESIEVPIESPSSAAEISQLVSETFATTLELKSDGVYKDGVYWKPNQTPIDAQDFGTRVVIHLHDDRQVGDTSEIEGPRFLEPEVSPLGLPGVQQVSEDHSVERASTASFTVDVTDVPFNPDSITIHNCYTYYDKTESFGVLRKGRLVDLLMGYESDEDAGIVTRFRGVIQKIGVSHQADGSKQLDVECVDLSKLPNEAQFTDAPDDTSYDIANLFSDTPLVAGKVRPPAYDGWKVVDVIRDLAYKSGVTSEQLYAVNNAGEYLIEDAGDRLMRTLAYPYERKNLPEGPVEAEYLWQVRYGERIWERMQTIAESLGRRLYFNMDGDLVFSRPNNPKYLVQYYDPSNPPLGDEVDRILGAVESEKAARALGGFRHQVSSLPVEIYFRGVGIALLMAREKDAISIQCELRAANSATWTLIDGINTLDSATQDRGSLDYITHLTDGRYPVGPLNVLVDDSFWYFKDGVHPRLGTNPSIIRVTDNLTYGDYVLRISKSDAGDAGSAYLEGALIYKTDVFSPVRTFTERDGNISLAADDSDEDMRNVVNVLGQTIGGRDYNIISRAVDIGSLKDTTAPNYLGREKAMTIQNPAIRNQDRAKFLAQYILRRYRRNARNPSLEIVGNPQIELHDCITIEDAETGFTSPIMLETSGRTDYLRDLPDPLDRFWVTGLQSQMDATGRYVTNLKATPFPPQPAYEPLPDPPKEYFGTDPAFKNVHITVDGSDVSTYNPYREDSHGEYVRIEFDQMFNASRVRVQVVSYTSLDYSIEGLDGSTSSAPTVPSNQPLYTVKYEEGFIPNGHYTFFWNGWWADENEGGSISGGRYYPNTGEVVFEFYLDRYSDGKAFLVRSNDPRTGVLGGVGQVTTMTMATSDPYTGTAISVNFEPDQSVTMASVNGGDLMKFSDQNSEYQGSLAVDVETNRPGGVYFAVPVYNITYFSPTADVNGWTSTGARTIEKYLYYLEGRLEEKLEVRDKGSHRYFLNPGVMSIIGTKPGWGVRKEQTLTERDWQMLVEDPIDRARERFKAERRPFDVPVPEITKLYFEHYGKVPGYDPTWKVFKFWLIRIPGSGQPDSENAGLVLVDKNADVHAYSASDRWIVWLGDEYQYADINASPTVNTLTSDSFTDQMADATDLAVSLSNVPTTRIL